MRPRYHLADAADGFDARIVREGELQQGVARPCPDELLRHVEDGIASNLARELHDHLTGMDHGCDPVTLRRLPWARR